MCVVERGATGEATRACLRHKRWNCDESFGLWRRSTDGGSNPLLPTYFARAEQAGVGRNPGFAQREETVSDNWRTSLVPSHYFLPSGSLSFNVGRKKNEGPFRTNQHRGTWMESS